MRAKNGISKAASYTTLASNDINTILKQIDKRNRDVASDAVERMRTNIFESCLKEWRKDGNPVDVFEALANWNRTDSLPADLAAFVSDSAATFIREVTKLTTFSEKGWSVEAGNKALVKAFGLGSTGQKGGNPFARYRDESLGYKAATSYMENCRDNPAMKSAEVIRFMADPRVFLKRK